MNNGFKELSELEMYAIYGGEDEKNGENFPTEPNQIELMLTYPEVYNPYTPGPV